MHAGNDSSIQRVSSESRQFIALARLELRRHVFGRNAAWLAFLSLAPAMVIALHWVSGALRSQHCSIESDSALFAWVFLVFQLRVAIYFGTLGVFARAFRGERNDRTLQYALMAPLRREWFVTTKYLADALGCFAWFGAGTALAWILMAWHHGGAGLAEALNAPNLLVLVKYLGICLLACLGYGAVFLALGHAFRNPVLGAIVFFGWESVSAMLPLGLQLLSVTFYLKPLFPVELPLFGISGLLTAAIEPLPTWGAVMGLLLISSLLVTSVAVAFRRVEVDSTD